MPSYAERVFRSALARGIPAMQAAELAFAADARHFPHESVKRCARDAIEVGLHDPQCRARYGARIRGLAGRDLDGAIAEIERAYCAERAGVAAQARYRSSPRLSLMVLGEMRLLARMLRRYQPYRLPEIMDAMTTPVRQVAA